MIETTAIGSAAKLGAFGLVTTLAALSACASSTPEPAADAYLLLQPTLRGEEASVSLELRHVGSGRNIVVKAGRQVQVVAVPSGRYRIRGARVPTMLSKRLAARSGMTSFEARPGRIAVLGRVYLVAQTGWRITGAGGHAGAPSARVEMLCDPDVTAAAVTEFPRILSGRPRDQICCDMEGSFDDFLQRGIIDLSCPVPRQGATSA